MVSSVLFTVNCTQIWLSPDPASTDTCVPLVKSMIIGKAAERRKEDVGHRYGGWRSLGAWCSGNLVTVAGNNQSQLQGMARASVSTQLQICYVAMEHSCDRIITK